MKSGEVGRSLQVQNGDTENEDTFIAAASFALVAVGEWRWKISKCNGNSSKCEDQDPVCNGYEINPYSSTDQNDNI